MYNEFCSMGNRCGIDGINIEGQEEWNEQESGME